MKMFWWQGGLHLEPKSKEEGEALELLTSNLQFTNLRNKIPSGPLRVFEGNNQDAVIAV